MSRLRGLITMLLYEVRAYTNKANEYLRIQSEIRKKIYDLFQAHGLDLTVPQPQVNMGMENRELKEDYKKSHSE